MKTERTKPKICKLAFNLFDGLLDAVVKHHGEMEIEGQMFPIDGTKTGVIFSSDGKPVQGFTIDANGKVREATIKKR